MVTTNPSAYWHSNSFSRTREQYRTPVFQAHFIDACVKTAEIINHKAKKSSANTDDTVVFIENSGVDDVLFTDSELNHSEPTSPSREKIQMFKSIFRDHIDEIAKLNPRLSITENIERMLNCGDPKNGGVMYACPDCEQSLRFSPLHCHSRFCPSCGNIYNMRRAAAMSSKVIDAPHRHVTFTIPRELRVFFRLDRDALNDLFAAVADTLFFIARHASKTQDYTPGFIAVLHTFGRDLKWNPHVHVLLCTKVFGNTSKGDFFLPYHLLRKSFQRCLLDRLKKRFGMVFSRLNSLIYQAYPDGFYVHAPNQNVNTDSVIKYIGRYLGRPPIASSRIDSFVDDIVTFHYTRHEDDKTVSESIPAFDFIKRLIVHIPDKNFKMVRYFGFYSSEGAHKEAMKKHHLKPRKTAEQKKRIFAQTKWRAAMINAFNIDPLKCSVCGGTMEPVYFSVKGHTYYFPSVKPSRALDIQFRFLMNQSSA